MNISLKYLFLSVLCLAEFGFSQNTSCDSNASQADRNTLCLEPMFVTASRREQATQWVSDDHNVINVNSLQLSTSQTVSELLESSITARISDYGVGAVKTISLRGVGSERTLILIDGKRIGTVDNDLTDISTNLIEKIEIVEGGQSALYGMDAIGGVVNVITKKINSEKLSGNAAFGLSSFEPRHNENTWKVPLDGNEESFFIGQKINSFGWNMGGNRQESDGKYKYPDSNNIFHIRENNSARNWELSPKFFYDKKPFSLDLSGNYCQRTIQSPGTISMPSQATTTKNIGAVTLGSIWEQKKSFTLKCNSSFAYDNTKYVDPNPFWPQDSKHERFREDVEIIQEGAFKKQLFNSGVEIYRFDIKSNEIGDHSLSQFGIFTNGIFKETASFLQFEQTPSLRFDYASIYGSTINGKIGAIVNGDVFFNPGLFFNIGNSYQSPSFDALYWPQDAYSKGNPGLKPEKSENFDFGFQMHYGIDNFSLRTRVSHYSINLHDMIIWGPDDKGIWVPKNVSAASVDGYKLDCSLKFLKDWNGSLNVHYNDARDKQTGRSLIYRPLYMFAGSMDHFGTNYNFGISYTYSGKVFTNDSNTTSLPGINTINFHTGYKIPIRFFDQEGLWLVYDIINATNRYYSTNDGYPLPGREHRLSLKMQF